MNEMFSGGDESLVSQFIVSVKSDIDSPVTSTFGSRIADYKSKALRIAKTVEYGAGDFERLHKASKSVVDSIDSLRASLTEFERVTKEAANRMSMLCESDIDSSTTSALLKMDSFIQGEIELTNLVGWNWHNNIVHPLELIVSSRGDVRLKGLEKACRDYESKFTKVEADAKKHAKQSGLTRDPVSHSEVSEQLCRERLIVQIELCKFLLSIDDCENKHRSQLLRHFFEFFRNQDTHYSEWLKINGVFLRDVEKLEDRLTSISSKHYQQRSELHELNTQLESSGQLTRTNSGRHILPNRNDSMRNIRFSMSQLNFSENAAIPTPSAADLSIFEQRNDSIAETKGDWLQSGYLYKKTNKKLHKQWQKRRCRIQDGHFLLSHSDESLPPVRLNLLVSDCKPSFEDPKAFDLYCRDRTYHMLAETDVEAKQWIVAIKYEISRVKMKMLSDDTIDEDERAGNFGRSDRLEFRLCLNALRSLPGNSECADCSSNEDVQWLSNTGALVCIACSGVHRELGVHISRIQSLELDVISPIEFLVPLACGNSMINRIYEYDEDSCRYKPSYNCTRADRLRFIQMKYGNRRFIHEIESADVCFSGAAINLDFERAYIAVLSSSLSSLPFHAHEAFHEMVVRGNPSAMPIIQLVIQFRVDIPGLESIVTDCITYGYIDALIILIRAKSNGCMLSESTLLNLENYALKLDQAAIANVLRMARTDHVSQLTHITIPASLIKSSPDSTSICCSSSSASPSMRPSPDTTALNSNHSRSLSPKANLPLHESANIPNSRYDNHTKKDQNVTVLRPRSQCFASYGVESRDGLSSSSIGRNTNSQQTKEHSMRLSTFIPNAKHESRLCDDSNIQRAPKRLPSVSNLYSEAPRKDDVIRDRHYDSFHYSPPNALSYHKHEPNIFYPSGREYANQLSDKSSCQRTTMHASSLKPSSNNRSKTVSSRSEVITSTSAMQDLPKKSYAADELFSKSDFEGKFSNRMMHRPVPTPPTDSSARVKPPLPVPRKHIASADAPKKEYLRRCRALYECTADRPDELSFHAGDVIIICKQRVDGESDTWMEGYLANNPSCRGIFPVTFVTFQC